MFKVHKLPIAWDVLFKKHVANKITFLKFLFLLIILHISANSFAQQISISKNNISLRDLLQEINVQTGYDFVWSTDKVNSNTKITVKGNYKSIDQVLKDIFFGLPLRYEISGKMILIKEKSNSKQTNNKVNPTENNQENILPEVRGRVVDEKGNGISSASIRLFKKGTQVVVGQTSTDDQGRFLFRNLPNDLLLEISHIGYKAGVTVNIAANIGDITLNKYENKIDEVVVSSGFVNRRAESFTGSATTFNNEQLLQAGSQNVLKSLKNLDPSFQLVENMAMGSNPNAMPDIQIRGQNSVPNLQGDFSGNPNMPLFILDGFETTVQRVNDLNMNRVATVTILKDAAAKAIYGSRAANGVVIIETIRPKAGQLQISYNADIGIESPDLTGYNLMSASEKLAFEVERGMYSKFSSNATNAMDYDNIYKQNYDNIARGVDTYWLSQPLRTGVSSKHALNLEGGDEKMRYMAGVTFNDQQGAMKGSGRQTLGINTGLSYTYKNFVFRNNLEYNRNIATNSPYGLFSDYVALNQYYSPYDANGNIVKVLGQNSLGNVLNPMYNATLNTKSQTNYTEFINNFNVNWKISSVLRAEGSLSYSRNENGSDVFYPGSHTMFNEYDANGWGDRKGRYTKGDGFSQMVNSNIGINLNKKFGKHFVFSNLTWTLNTRRNSLTTVDAEGFGNDNMDNISFASKYLLNGKPSGSDNTVREIGVVGMVNYSFDDRYLLDASLRTSGSSMYGADNRWGTFWALGAGWNLHKESFIQNSLPGLTQLKLRSSMGYSGSQSFNPYQARLRYTYGEIPYNGFLGAELMGLPNNDLRWQRTMDYNMGLDIAYKSFLTGKFDYYISETTDLLSDMTVPPSLGFSSYKENFGETRNEGFEFNLGVTPWRNNGKRGWVTLNVSTLHNKNKLTKIYGIFDAWNKSQDAEKEQVPTPQTQGSTDLKNAYTRPGTYFYEGVSMDAIWGVRSLGIDPVSGQELFLDRNGNPTWVWSLADQVVIGNKNPKFRGNFGINAGYQGFILSVTCSYKFGGDLYNSTLIDKIENVTGYNNLDRRILDSWRNVGDIAPYRVLTLSAGSTPVYTRPTSRVVQRENEIYISSINIGYDLQNKEWLRRYKLSNLRLAFYMNDFARISSVTIERGTSYPFARNYSFMLRASF